jgi:hypothetical protein
LQAKQQLEFKLPLNHPALAGLWDHRVNGAAIMPGAGFFETAVAAAATLTKVANARVALTTATIAAPLPLPKPAEAASQILVVDVAFVSGDIGLRSVAADGVQAGRRGSRAAGNLHLRGSYAKVVISSEHISPAGTAGAASADVVRAACCEPRPTAAVYSQLQSAGLQYGPSFRCTDSIQTPFDSTTI